MIQMKTKIIACFTVAFLFLLLAAPWPRRDMRAIAQQSGRGHFSGSFSSTEVLEAGVVAKAAGSMTFNVNADAGTFTCVMNGSISGGGSFKLKGQPARGNITGSVTHQSCSGTYDPASGAINGRLTGNTSATMSITVIGAGEDGEDKTVTQSDSQQHFGPVSGNIGAGGGSGKFIDEEDGSVIRWEVHGSFSASEAPAPEPHADDTAEGEEYNPCDDDALSDACFDYMDRITGGSELGDLDDMDWDDEEFDKEFENPCDVDSQSDECFAHLKKISGGSMFDEGPCAEDEFSKECDDYIFGVEELEDIIDDDELYDILFGDSDKKPTPEQMKEAAEKIAEDAFENKKENPTKEDVKKSDLSKKLKAITDPKTRKAIVREFLKYKREHDDADIKELSRKLAEIQDRQEIMADLNSKAEKMKADLGDKLTEGMAKAIDSKLAEAWEWAKDASPEQLKDTMLRMNENEITLSDTLAAKKNLDDYVSKAKDIYQVSVKINEINKKVKSGRITEAQAKVLRGGTILALSLKYASKGVPIFGDHISDIIDGTMAVSLKFAGKRAERTAAIDACLKGSALSDECLKAIEDGRITAY